MVRLMREDAFFHSCGGKPVTGAPGGLLHSRVSHDTPRRDRAPGARLPRGAGRRGVSPGVTPGVSRDGQLLSTWQRVRGSRETRVWEEAMPWHEAFEQQERRLAQQARELGLPTRWQPPVEAAPLPGGAEHRLWQGTDGRMYKMTKEDHFGQVPCYNPASETGWENFAAAPADYLERLTLLNDTFGDDLRVEGLCCGRTVAIATSQPLATPARAHQPHPRRRREVETYMEARGFVNLGFSAWYHPQKKLMVTDATPDNFIRTAQGLRPVDLMICRARGPLLRLLQRKLASGQPNDERRLALTLRHALT